MTRWLDPVEQRAWRGLVEVFSSVSAALEAELVAAHGLTQGDYAVLVQLSEAPARRLRMCDLAARLHLSPSGLTRRIDGMVRQGLVARESAPEDRRVTLAVLTDDGMAKLDAAAPDHVEGVRRHLIDLVEPDRLRVLGETFDAIRAARALECDAARRATGAEVDATG